MQLFSATSWRANYEKTYSGILAIFFLRKRPELELAQFFSKDYWNFLYFCQVTSMENKASAMVFHKVHWKWGRNGIDRIVDWLVSMSENDGPLRIKWSLTINGESNYAMAA